MNENVKLFLVAATCFSILSFSGILFGSSKKDIVVERAQPEHYDTAPVNHDTAPVNVVKKEITEPNYVSIENDHVDISIDSATGLIAKVLLKNYNVNTDDNNNKVSILTNKENEVYFAVTECVFESIKTDNCLWSILEKSSDGHGVTLSAKLPNNIRLEKKITIDDRYMMKITDSVTNNSPVAQKFHVHGVLKRSIPKVESNLMLHEGFVGVLNGKLIEKNYDKIGKKDEINIIGEHVENGWYGFTDKYWLTAFSTDFATKIIGSEDKNTVSIDFTSDDVVIAPGETVEKISYMFCGAKELGILDLYKTKYNFTKFDLAIDFGWFYFITRPMMNVLKFLHDLLGNFGWAIILLTFALKVLFIPISRKSNKSMSAMKNLQPKITKLKEMYSGDKLRLNQAMAELYKKEKINPVSGCFPMLLQIVVFCALYKILFICIDMRHAEFCGWIHDLSAPDPLSIFNLFGLINWSLPQFLHIGLWPIFVSVTMFLQQRLTPTTMSTDQAKIMTFLPLVFLVMFAQLPVGLVIYSTCSNLFAIIQQLTFSRMQRVTVK
jgi:YidC/Oxa1 family membrane protein insertase